MIRFELFEVGYGPFRDGAVPHAGSASFRAAFDAGYPVMAVPIGDVEVTFSRAEGSDEVEVHQIRLRPAKGLSGTMLAHALTSVPGQPDTVLALVDLAVDHWRATHNGGPVGEAVLRVG